MLSASDISYGYRDGGLVIRNLNMEIPAGSRNVVTGPSGCGKTTLLHLLAGLKRPASGQVLLEGGMLQKPDKKISIVFQDYGLLPWKTVYENAELPLVFRNMPRRQREGEIRQLFEKTGLTDILNRYPDELSGGQRQRTAVVRALVGRPEILLLDEPFSALDSFLREELQDFLAELQAEEGISTVLVTHNIEEAVCLGDNVFVMDGSGSFSGRAFFDPGETRVRNSDGFYARVKELRCLMDGGEKC